MAKHDKHDKHHKHHKSSKADKQLAKQHETDEEKRERRLAKKAAKEARRGDDTQVAGYSNETNPWNDPNLTEQFRWGKKVERDRSRGIEESTSREAQKRKRMELAVELDKVKRSREEREREKEAWEEERRMLEREREQMAFADNEKREDEFQFQQTKERAHIRTKEGRARPIDVLCESLTLLDPDLDPEAALEIELQVPMDVFHQLSIRELNELKTDISAYGELDQGNTAFWRAMTYMCEHSLQEKQTGGQHSHGVHSAVQSDVDGMLATKSLSELDVLQDQITANLQGGEDVDTDYWESVLVQLRLARARATLSEMYEQLRRRRTELCGAVPTPAASGAPSGSAAAGATAGSLSPELEPELATSRGSGRFSPELLPEDEVDYDEGGSDDAAELSAIEAAEAGASDPSGGRYSPVLLSAQEVNRDEAIDEADDYRQLQAQRARVRSRAMDAAKEPADGAAGLVDAEARKGMDAGEARFSFEVPLEQKVAWWHDKYRPRKPKYFNRVHTGYEWNKYNQTHYDHDNPPPKMVQGYKFNIFYPDLIDRTKTPTYQLLPDPSGAKDTCILRFHGGPPYEDLAFKIVNREWEMSHKRGFRVRFERGILQVFFNFKRSRYRR